MNSLRIAVMDSGIGGLSVLKELVNTFSNCDFIYFGDNDNAPYGVRTSGDLFSLTLKNLCYVLSFDVDVIVFACNTLSVVVLDRLRDFSPVPIVGIYPPVERSVMENSSVLLLATDVTASKFSGIKRLDSVGISPLVNVIENNFFSLQTINLSAFLPSQKKFYDVVILGCTHFNFVKNQIFNHFCPRKILGGEIGAINKLSRILSMPKTSEKIYRNCIKFIGNSAFKNQKIWLKISN